MTTLAAIELIQEGMFGYGFRITIADFCELDGITEPDYAAMNQPEQIIQAAQQNQLAILGLYGAINDQLLIRGRKLTKNGTHYEVPTIGNTLKYVAQYDNRSYNNSIKAEKLLRSFNQVNPNYEQTNQERTAQAKAHRMRTNRDNDNGPSAI